MTTKIKLRRPSIILITLGLFVLALPHLQAEGDSIVSEGLTSVVSESGTLQNSSNSGNDAIVIAKMPPNGPEPVGDTPTDEPIDYGCNKKEIEINGNGNTGLVCVTGGEGGSLCNDKYPSRVCQNTVVKETYNKARQIIESEWDCFCTIYEP